VPYISVAGLYINSAHGPDGGWWHVPHDPMWREYSSVRTGAEAAAKLLELGYALTPDEIAKLSALPQPVREYPAPTLRAPRKLPDGDTVERLKAARAAKDYATADALRQQLRDAGFDVRFTRDGEVMVR
jgi:hypothetical protein